MNEKSEVHDESTEPAPSAHENQHSERKPPKTPINPFRVKNQREWTQNFPPLDQAFETISLNESSASAALSISVQAALQKHNHDVALYGIEHDRVDSSLDKKTTPTSVHPLDEKWNKYNESPNTSHTSGSNSFDHNGYETKDTTAQDQSGIILPTDVGKPEEAIEVLTDKSMSYDNFFQNASIELLKTPESCRLRSISPTQRLTTRRARQLPGSSEVSTSFTDESEMRAMVRLAGLGSPVSKFDISGETAEGSKLLNDTFALDRVDLSRISAADSDLIRNANNNSLLLNQSAISACSSIDNNFQLDKCLHHKFLSSPLNTSTGTFGRSPIHLPPRYLSPQRQNFNEFSLKEAEIEPESDAVASPSSDCTPASDWRSIQNRFATSPLPHNGSNSFLQNNEGSSFLFSHSETKPSDQERSTNRSNSNKKSSSLSSISPNTSSLVSDHDHHQLAIKHHSSSFENIGSSSPSPTSVIPVDNLFASDDPRRWRTVVPKRVFLSEPHQFPLEDDSFSCHHHGLNYSDDTRSMFGNAGAVQEDGYGPLIAERSVRSL